MLIAAHKLAGVDTYSETNYFSQQAFRHLANLAQSFVQKINQELEQGKSRSLSSSCKNFDTPNRAPFPSMEMFLFPDGSHCIARKNSKSLSKFGQNEHYRSLTKTLGQASTGR